MREREREREGLRAEPRSCGQTFSFGDVRTFDGVPQNHILLARHLLLDLDKANISFGDTSSTFILSVLHFDARANAYFRPGTDALIVPGGVALEVLEHFYRILYRSFHY